MTMPIGTIGVTPTYGSALDKFVGESIRFVTGTEDQFKHFKDAAVNHAVVYVGRPNGFEKPQLVQAQPGGAAFADWDSYHDEMMWLTDISSLAKDGTLTRLTPTDAQREIIAQTAIDLALKHVGYNYLDFVAIALAQKRFGTIVKDDPSQNSWLLNEALKRLANNNRMICSQLADYCWAKGGQHLFDDSRPYGLVSPEDLFLLESVST